VKFKYNDGGRQAAGFRGAAGDCVTRSIAIAAELPYADVYAALAEGMGSQRKSKGATARNGVSTNRKWFKDYMRSIGWKWTPTMLIGSGCKVHLSDGELPLGRLIVAVSKHYTAVIDHVIHDTFSPEREAHVVEPDRGQELKPGQWRNPNGICYVQRRCVYGYWSKA
jgi:hypothetical protein